MSLQEAVLQVLRTYPDSLPVEIARRQAEFFQEVISNFDPIEGRLILITHFTELAKLGKWADISKLAVRNAWYSKSFNLWFGDTDLKNRSLNQLILAVGQLRLPAWSNSTNSALRFVQERLARQALKEVFLAIGVLEFDSESWVGTYTDLFLAQAKEVKDEVKEALKKGADEIAKALPWWITVAGAAAIFLGIRQIIK